MGKNVKPKSGMDYVPVMGRLRVMENRIAEIRRARGLTMEQLGDLIGTGPTTVNKLEKGERKLHIAWMRKIAAALNVTPADLLLERDNPSRPHDVPLSAEERELIEAYRGVPRKNRARILRMILLMLREYRNEDAA